MNAVVLLTVGTLLLSLYALCLVLLRAPAFGTAVYRPMIINIGLSLTPTAILIAVLGAATMAGGRQTWTAAGTCALVFGCMSLLEGLKVLAPFSFTPLATPLPPIEVASTCATTMLGLLCVTVLSSFLDNIADDQRISADVAGQVTIAVGGGVDFVDSDDVSAGLADAGVPEAEAQAIVEDYEDAQLQALKVGLLAAAFLALVSLSTTKGLPSEVVAAADEADDRAAAASS